MFTPITVGVVGPSRKLASTPMRAIVSALRHADPNLNVIQLDDAFMLNTPIALWPSLHVLVALYAPPFPLEKVLAYVKLRRPVLVNNLYMQPYMMDRRCIRAVLRREGVPTPNAVFVDRANGDVVTQSSGGNVLRVETLRGVSHTMEKPFVEKPVDPEDHSTLKSSLAFPAFLGNLAKHSLPLPVSSLLSVGVVFGIFLAIVTWSFQLRFFVARCIARYAF